MSEEIALELRDVAKVYNEGMSHELTVLKNINIKIKKGELVSIIGPSGSGKTTLLDIMGCLMEPSRGNVLVDGIDIHTLNDNDVARIRGKKIGFVFQQYNLIPSFTAQENVAIAMRIMGATRGESLKKAAEILELVGLNHRFTHKPSQLSGGEQQRVAIARSLVNSPSIVLGDEPTGNLDTKTGDIILKLLKNLNQKEGYTIVIVTHDMRISEFTNRVIMLKDGEVIKS